MQLKRFLVVKTKEVLRHELHQEHVLDMISTNLNRVTWDHVLSNPAVVNKTAELIDLLLKQERSKNITLDLGIKGLKKPAVLDRLSYLGLERTSQFVRDSFTKKKILDLLYKPSDDL